MAKKSMANCPSAWLRPFENTPVMRPSEPTLYVQVFEGTERRFAGTIAGGSGAVDA